MQYLSRSKVLTRSSKRKFTSDAVLAPYTQQAMVDAAESMLTLEGLSEEGFLGAQAVLMLNGIL